MWLVDLHGEDQPRLLSKPDVEAMYQAPQWSPDGGSLYVVTDLNRDLATPACIDVTSGQLTYVVEPDVEVDEATLDPTGQRLAYAINHDGNAEIRVRNLRERTELSVNGLPDGALYTYWQPGLAWDPSGQRLAISWTGSAANPNVFIWANTAQSERQVTEARRGRFQGGAS